MRVKQARLAALKKEKPKNEEKQEREGKD